MPNGPLVDLLKNLRTADFTNDERAVAVIWLACRFDESVKVPYADIKSCFVDAGYSAPSGVWLRTKLKADQRVLGGKSGPYRPNARKLAELDQKFGPYVSALPSASSSSVLDPSIFERTRGYIEKVVVQINNSYDNQLYDCCAVMCRRLIETLIIEVYEAGGIADAIKGSSGHFCMLAELVAILKGDARFNLGRNAEKGLDDLKRLGDLSAHNRRYNARRNDIDRVKSDLRVVSEELLNLAAMGR
ncbi:hypothetical protein [Pyruvatibacter mobilis]|uniref:hypothetical protein n=1 Tax=Pyruvatibacter mobilis TaxID=1712261 RepID=UPI0019622F12|nr:hypothetical protein [Pyruvatibacter mobilis]GGD18572.1 hypothetical protein GCM10011587_23680 [Pyruvatibacter mobilis]